MIRVLIADDHAVVRRGLRQIVSEASDMSVVAEAADGSEALAIARETDIDVIILDIAMPARGGLDVLKEIRAGASRAQVVVLSVHSDEQYALRAFRDGASAYLEKGSAPEELVEAIRAAAAGHRFITAAIAELMANTIGGKGHSGDRLSDRELQVLVLLAKGRTITEVSRLLALSPKTVSTYRARTLAKLGLTTNAQLIRYALQQGLDQG